MTLLDGVTVVLTAALSSGLTLGLGGWLYRQRLEQKLERRLLQIQDEFERRVKQGVLAAGRELLPELRREVAAGFSDAVRDTPASAVEGGMKAVEKGLGSLFGFKPRS